MAGHLAEGRHNSGQQRKGLTQQHPIVLEVDVVHKQQPRIQKNEDQCGQALPLGPSSAMRQSMPKESRENTCRKETCVVLQNMLRMPQPVLEY